MDNLLTVRPDDTGGPGGIIDSVWLQSFDLEDGMHYTSFGKQKAQVAPRWAKEGVLYEVFVRDFSPTGDFKGLTAKLDELDELGITILWLMPIHPIGEVNRKGTLGSPYSVQDYYGINADFGTGDDFRHLVEEVHARDMHIILDMVPNHTACDNALMTDHEDWYTHDSAGNIVSPNDDWSDVADLDYGNSELRNYIQTMLAWWITEYNVDGFRIDVAEMMPGDFWLDTRTILKATKADVFLLAEGSRPYLHVSGFDATYAFNSFRDFRAVAKGKDTPEAIHQAMRNERYGYPQGALRMRFLENHDQLRAGDVLKQEERLLAASIGAFLLPGLPMLYNGAELGIAHRLELFDQDVIDWDSGSTYYRSQIAEIFKLRKQYPALIEGDYQPHDYAGDVLIYGRNTEHESVVVAVNYGSTEVELKTSDNNLTPLDVLYHTEGAVFDKQSTRVTLPPYGGIVLR
ncbi:alpha-amylase family glycosyl hydrolase [Candidatus Neomarinimicrobiota bacterium]